MAKFESVRSHVVVLDRDDVDTDQIIPARFLKATSRVGFGDNLFADWRYDSSGKPKPEFPLNKPEAAGAKILLAGDNFGCGSSREHAPWALVGWGLSAVIAQSFADIFRGNSLKNGLLPVALGRAEHAKLLEQLTANPRAEVSIDLASQRVRFPDDYEASFAIDGFAKHCLLQGIDELGYLLSFKSEIEAYESRGA